MSNAEAPKPWFQQPLVWMLIMVPGSAVVMGFTMLYLAIDSFDGMVVDDYYKHGKEINRVLKRDHRAGELGLVGEISLSSQAELHLVHRPGYMPPDRLKLRFLHTTRAGFDREVAMILKGRDRYLGVAPELAPGGWHVLLEDPDWRISGELVNEKQTRFKLVPVL